VIGTNEEDDIIPQNNAMKSDDTDKLYHN
jgi:hypothetical protein